MCLPQGAAELWSSFPAYKKTGKPHAHPFFHTIYYNSDIEIQTAPKACRPLQECT